MNQIRFLADVHLGKLARYLCMLGIDTYYKNELSYAELLQTATTENRTVLSRNKKLEKESSLSFLWIESEDFRKQLQQVIRDFRLEKCFHPFTRCLICNARLEPREKGHIAAFLEENTKRYFDQFWQCSSCQRIYWKGSHYERMTTLLSELEVRL